MRIAVVCSDQGVRVPGAKGASIHLTSITRAFAALGHEVRLYGVAGHGAAPEGIDARLLPHPGRATGLRREVRKIRFTEHFLRAQAADLSAFAPELVYERLALFGTAGRRLAAMADAVHVLEVNALLSTEEAAWRGLRLQGLAQRREREVLEAADRCIAVSAETSVQIARLAPRARTTVVPNGVELDLFARLPSAQEARRRFDLPRGARLVGFTGALRPWHGLDVAIRSLAHLDADTMLVVAGDGAARPELEALAARLGVAPRVRWLGQIDHTSVPAFLAALDAAVAPYPQLDGFAFSPLKLFEYLAAGVPVVASDIGQVREVLEHGRLGALVPPGDDAALAIAVACAVGNPRRSRELATEARGHAFANFGWADRARSVLDAAEGRVDALVG